METSNSIYEKIGKLTALIEKAEMYIDRDRNDCFRYSGNIIQRIADREYIIRRLKAYRLKKTAELCSIYYNESVKLKAA